MTFDYASLELPDPPAGRPYAAINMVMTADGRTVVGGTERGIGSAADQRLMRELRVHFDVVLNGGGTFRASGTSARLGREDLRALRVSRGLPPSPIAAVLTRSGDLPAGRRFFTDDSFDAVIYLASDAPAGRGSGSRRWAGRWSSCRPSARRRRRWSTCGTSWGRGACWRRAARV